MAAKLLIIIALVLSLLVGWFLRPYVENAFRKQSVHYLLLSEDAAGRGEWQEAFFYATKAASEGEDGYFGFDRLGSLYVCLGEMRAAVLNYDIAHLLKVGVAGAKESLYFIKARDLELMAVDAFKEKYHFEC